MANIQSNESKQWILSSIEKSKKFVCLIWFVGCTVLYTHIDLYDGQFMTIEHGLVKISQEYMAAFAHFLAVYAAISVVDTYSILSEDQSFGLLILFSKVDVDNNNYGFIVMHESIQNALKVGASLLRHET